MKTHPYYRYSPIIKRADFKWPQGKSLAVYFAINLEHHAFGEGLGAELGAKANDPDVLNYAWRDYGNRVGIWRILELFDSLKLPAAALVNASIYDYCPEIMDAFRARKDEVVTHGHSNSEKQGVLSIEQETLLIQKTTAIIRNHEGTSPRGWLSPWISESCHTPLLLKKAGYQYLLDWCHDDQPTWFATGAGPILSIPYPQEINDLPAIVVRKHSAQEFADMIIDQFDEMLEQSQQQSLVFAVALHPFIVGQPFRLRALRLALTHIANHAQTIWLTHPQAIADHFAHYEVARHDR